MLDNHIEQLMQIFNGAIWDGDLISKDSRTQLVKAGLVEQTGGYNIITSKGVGYVIDLGLIRPGFNYVE